MATLTKDAKADLARRRALDATADMALGDAALAVFAGAEEVRVQERIAELERAAKRVLGRDVTATRGFFEVERLSEVEKVGCEIDGLRFGIVGGKLCWAWSDCVECGAARPLRVDDLDDLGSWLFEHRAGTLPERFGDMCSYCAKQRENP